ncbi:MAG: di-trans,poly-cis-decaprenylcistransferase, partial [Clostridia bacterium]|nr:di-trans,poly-cis-decaprenylcistransferase [Clostridia bacterium]
MKFNLPALLRPRASEASGCPPKEKLPRHIAFIMDGNGRWAKRRGLPRSAGHAAGTEALREIIRTCSDIGIECMSIYAFSTENWERPQDEVEALMKL